VLADEFQDVNFAEFTRLRPHAAAHGEIFMVTTDQAGAAPDRPRVA
jgi:hypothetical protein